MSETRAARLRGRRPEDFPEARKRDAKVLGMLHRSSPGLTRNHLAALVHESPDSVRYALDRLRNRGLVIHVAKGHEGHGYWTTGVSVGTAKETRNDPRPR